MTKDGIADKARRTLRSIYDDVTKEPVPAEFKELLAKLK